ncbi:hypothetical protein BGZ68_007854 [Mortierella alpina]|nr:hypothetical protein BGZ68_007854 [Mortierella alpina]
MTIPLSSPPGHAPKHQTFGEGGVSFTKAQSTDSQATPMRKGASAFLSGFGNASLQEQDSGSQAAMSREMAERTQMRRMMNDQAQPFAAGPLNQPRQSDGLNPRSSMMTFGSRMSTNSPPRITMSSSFASLRELISSATGLVRSSTSVSENATATSPFAPFSPTTNLARAQSTAYGGGGGGRHSINGVHSLETSAISFSPSSRRKTALVVMAPTIVVAQKLSSTKKDEEEKDRDTSSMHTISGSPDTSASSSLTVISSSLDQEQQQQQGYEDRSGDEEVTGLEFQGKHLESKKSEFNGHASLSTELTPPGHIPYRQQLATTTTTRPRHHSLLKVPEPAKAGSSNHHHHHRRQQSPPTSVAASAMAAAQRAWLSSLGLTRGERELIRSTSSFSATVNISVDSLTGPLTGDDYIGQFERERAKARGTMMNMSTSAGSFAAETETPSTIAASSSTTLTASNASDHDGHTSLRGDWKMKSKVGTDEIHSNSKTRPPRPPPIRRCNTSPDNHRSSGGNGGFRRSFLQTVRIRRESSGPLDMSDKLMHLPEPSRFEGMCSCRGVINIASMLLILLGLVLLILGYPIATSLNKDQVAAEAAAGMSATAPATGSDVFVAAAPVTGSSPIAAMKRSSILTGEEGMTTMMDKRARFAREGRSMNVVFSDEFRRKCKLV